MEKEHVLSVLKETKEAVREENIVKLKSLSNKTLHSASIEQDPDSVTIAVILYSLSKIIERKKYSYYEEWPSFYKKYMGYIEEAISSLEKDDLDGFRKNINRIRKEINRLSGRFKKYIQDVFRKAEINKASRIYEHGISMEQTAKLLGITIWELAEYSGQTGISDVDLSVTLPIRKRLDYAEEIFKK
jgi:hypothetical protein